MRHYHFYLQTVLSCSHFLLTSPFLSPFLHNPLLQALHISILARDHRHTLGFEESEPKANETVWKYTLNYSASFLVVVTKYLVQSRHSLLQKPPLILSPFNFHCFKLFPPGDLLKIHFSGIHIDAQHVEDAW